MSTDTSANSDSTASDIPDECTILDDLPPSRLLDAEDKTWIEAAFDTEEHLTTDVLDIYLEHERNHKDRDYVKDLIERYKEEVQSETTDDIDRSGPPIDASKHVDIDHDDDDRGESSTDDIEKSDETTPRHGDVKAEDSNKGSTGSPEISTTEIDEPAESSGTTDTGSVKVSETSPDPHDVLDGSADDVKERISNIDDPEFLTKLRNLEVETNQRGGVIDAIDLKKSFV